MNMIFLRIILFRAIVRSHLISFLILVLHPPETLPAEAHFQQRHNIHQKDMILRYISGRLFSALWEFNITQTVQIQNATTSATNESIADIVPGLLLEINAVLHKCSAKYACDCDQNICVRSAIPCGSIFQRSAGSVYNSTVIRVPKSFSINVTLLDFQSGIHAKQCIIEQLIIRDDEERMEEICGRRRLESYYFPSHNASVIWHKRSSYDEEASYCLMYEAISKDYAVLIENKTPFPVLQPEDVCKELPRDCPGTQIIDIRGPLRNLLNSIFLDGNKWTYTWHLRADVLKTPIITILSLVCGSPQGAKNSVNPTSGVRVTDGPFSKHEQPFVANLFRYRFIHCTPVKSMGRFVGSIGDLTVQAIWNLGDTIAVRMRFALTDLPCMAPACSFQEVQAKEGAERVFVTSSNHTSLRHLWITKPAHLNGFLELQNMSFYYDGLGHLPCVLGGIYIYEMLANAMFASLVTKICTSSIGQIWSKQRQTGAFNSLHFSDMPILIVIKSYGQRTGMGYLEGYAKLSPCEGIMNPLFRGVELQFSYRHGRVRRTLRNNNIVTDILNVSDCAIVQEILVEGDDWDYKLTHNLGFQIVEQDDFDGHIPSAEAIGCFDLTPDINTDYAYSESFKDLLCNNPKLYFPVLDRYFVPLDARAILAKRGCFRHYQAFSRDAWELVTSIACMLNGLKLSVVINVKGADDASDGKLRSLEHWVKSQDFKGENALLVPLCRHGIIPFHKIHSPTELFFARVETGKGKCCYHKMTMTSTQAFFHQAIQYIILNEDYTTSETTNIRSNKDYEWHSANEHYKCPTMSEKRLAQKRNQYAKNFSLSHTTNSMLAWITVTLDLMPDHWTQNYTWNLEFKYLDIVKILDETHFTIKKPRRMSRLLCVKSTETCYKALIRGKSISWDEARHVCEGMGMGLITFNTEMEWRLAEQWFTRHVYTDFKMFKEVQMFFLGARLATVGDRQSMRPHRYSFLAFLMFIVAALFVRQCFPGVIDLLNIDLGVFAHLALPNGKRTRSISLLVSLTRNYNCKSTRLSIMLKKIRKISSSPNDPKCHN